MPDTKLQQVSSALFFNLHGQTLADWIAERRAEGMAWRQIEKALYAKTDGVIDVSNPTLLSWYGNTDDRQDAA